MAASRNFFYRRALVLEQVCTDISSFNRAIWGIYRRWYTGPKSVMWAKQYGKNIHLGIVYTIYKKNGDFWAMVYYCFTHITWNHWAQGESPVRVVSSRSLCKRNPLHFSMFDSRRKWQAPEWLTNFRPQGLYNLKVCKNTTYNCNIYTVTDRIMEKKTFQFTGAACLW